MKSLERWSHSIIKPSWGYGAWGEFGRKVERGQTVNRTGLKPDSGTLLSCSVAQSGDYGWQHLLEYFKIAKEDCRGIQVFSNIPLVWLTITHCACIELSPASFKNQKWHMWKNQKNWKISENFSMLLLARVLDLTQILISKACRTISISPAISLGVYFSPF